ncbi:MAG: hypothetical protein JJU02_09490 [Cryomorphaceae bacterium]|nr:hypothetical protein [Cryomorphaceae bacterium]
MRYLLFLFLLLAASKSEAQNFSLRLDAGLMGSANATTTPPYFSNRYYAFTGGSQFLYHKNDRNAFSIGLFLQQFRTRVIQVHWFHEQVSEKHLNYLTIPIQWHRSFGKTRRFEFSTGIFYSQFISGSDWFVNELGEAEDRNSWDWRVDNNLGVSSGIRYAFLQREKITMAVSLRSFWTVHNFQRPSHPGYVSSLLSLQCGIAL